MEIGEAAPDIEVTLNLYRDNQFVKSFEVNVNKKRKVVELKQWLGRSLGIETRHLRIQFDDTELEDTNKILTYEIETDDELTLIDESP